MLLVHQRNLAIQRQECERRDQERRRIALGIAGPVRSLWFHLLKILTLWR